MNRKPQRSAADRRVARELSTGGQRRVTTDERDRFATVEVLLAHKRLRLIGRGVETTKATPMRPARSRGFIDYGPIEERI